MRIFKDLIDWIWGSEGTQADDNTSWGSGVRVTSLWEKNIQPPVWTYLETTSENRKSKFHRLPKGAYGKS